MLEIIAIMLLSNANSRAAKARGRSGGGAVGYTLGLWFGLEILGALIGAAAVSSQGPVLVYVFALIFALIGGGASWAIAHAGPARVQPPWGAPGAYPAAFPTQDAWPQPP
ncbi:MAG: hypothetical protein LBG60_08365, partial [Bifidobacteriaceae bacterium]|nr:hypothetical protein [Bifidobacteriaceae bacterium]